MMDWKQSINGIDLLMAALGFAVGYGFRWWSSLGARELIRAADRGEITINQLWPCDRCNRQIRVAGPTAATAVMCVCGGACTPTSAYQIGPPDPNPAPDAFSNTNRLIRNAYYRRQSRQRRTE